MGGAWRQIEENDSIICSHGYGAQVIVIEGTQVNIKEHVPENGFGTTPEGDSAFIQPSSDKL